MTKERVDCGAQTARQEESHQADLGMLKEIVAGNPEAVSKAVQGKKSSAEISDSLAVGILGLNLLKLRMKQRDELRK